MGSTRTPRIVENVQRFPHQIAKSIRVSQLNDESIETVEEVVKTLMQHGHRAELLAVAQESGLDAARRAVIRSACSGTLH